MNEMLCYFLGAVHKLCHPGRGREGVGQMLTLDDMAERGGQGKTDRLTPHLGGVGGNVKSESKVAITLTLNVLLGCHKCLKECLK